MTRYPSETAKMIAAQQYTSSSEIILDTDDNTDPAGVLDLPTWTDHTDDMRDATLTAAGWRRVRPWVTNAGVRSTTVVRSDDHRPVAATVTLLDANRQTIGVEDAATSYAGFADFEHYEDLHPGRSLAPRITAVWRDADGRELAKRILHDAHEREIINRARESQEATEYHRAEVGRQAAARAATVREMRKTMPIAVVAAALGISEPAVTKLVKQAPAK